MPRGEKALTEYEYFSCARVEMVLMDESAMPRGKKASTQTQRDSQITKNFPRRRGASGLSDRF